MKNPLRRLHWKLVVLFALVSTAVSVVINIIGLTFSLEKAPSVPDYVDQIEVELAPISREISDTLTKTPIDLASLYQKATMLLPIGEVIGFRNTYNGTLFIPSASCISIFDETGLHLISASHEKRVCESLTPIDISDSLNGKPSTLIDSQTPETLILFPIHKNKKTVGFVQIRIFIPTLNNVPVRDFVGLYFEGFSQTLFTSLFFGAIFGYVMSGGLLTRIHTITIATTQWSQGVFDIRIQDDKGDEISELADNLNVMAEDLEQLVASRMELATMEERTRIARDLHDTVQQKVFSTQMHLSSAETILPQQINEAMVMIEHARVLNRQIQSELVEIIHALRPGGLENQGFVGAIRTYAENWSERNDIQVDIVHQLEPYLSVSMEDTLYRVTQEALANIEKHAKARRVSIGLLSLPEVFQLIIMDDGVGFDTSEISHGRGLQNIRTRIEECNGSFQMKSQPNCGTTLIAILHITATRTELHAHSKKINPSGV